VIFPWKLRPLFFFRRTTSDFSRGFLRSVISTKSLTDAPRRPALVGL